MGRTNKDNKYKSYRSDRAKEFNRDERRKQKHERDALRSGNVDRLIDIEDESGNTFYTADGIDYQLNRSLWPSGCTSEKEFEREINASNILDFEEWQANQKDYEKSKYEQE